VTVISGDGHSSRFPSPPKDSSRALMVVWSLGELFCAVLCTTVVHNDTHTREQFLNLHIG